MLQKVVASSKRTRHSQRPRSHAPVAALCPVRVGQEPHSLKYPNSFIERPHFQSRALLLLAARSEAVTGAPSGWLYYASDLFNPCRSDKCGGATPRAPMRTGDLFSSFPVANFIWQSQSLDDIFANGDGQFVYPGINGVTGAPVALSSIRYKNLRDGLQDWELFRLCPKVAQTLLASVVRGPTDWTQDQVLLNEARAACARAAGEAAAAAASA